MGKVCNFQKYENGRETAEFQYGRKPKNSKKCNIAKNAEKVQRKKLENIKAAEQWK